MNDFSFSTICLTAIIIDLQDISAYRYADLDVRQVTPGIYQPTTHETAHVYLVVWPGGVVAHYVSRESPDQFQPATLEALYSQATHLKPVDMSGRWKRRR